MLAAGVDDRRRPAGRAPRRSRSPRPRTSRTPGSVAQTRGELSATRPRRSRAARRRSPRTTAHAAAQVTGLPPNVEPWSPGSKALGASRPRRAARRSATRSPRPFASVTRSGAIAELLVGEERPGAADARLHLVDAEQRAELARARPRRANSGVERDRRRPRPAPARAGSSPTSPVADGRCERLDVVRRRERDAGHERLEGLPLRRAGRSPTSAPSVRPWKPPSSATTPGLPVALRAYLIAASIGLGARVAEERLRAAEALREQRRRARLIGSVQYRFEACQSRSSCACGGGERRRVAVTERRRRRSRRRSRGTSGPRRPRRGSPRRGRWSRRRARTSAARVEARDDRATDAHATPRSRRSRRARRAGRPDGRQELRHDAAFERARRRASGRPRRAASSTTPPSTRTPGTSLTKTIRSAPSPTASAAAASSAFTFSGPTASGAHDRDAAGGERVEHRGRRATATGSPTRPSPAARSARSPISSPASADAAGPIAAHTSAFTAASDSRTTSSPAGRRHAATGDERGPGCRAAPLGAGSAARRRARRRRRAPAARSSSAVGRRLGRDAAAELEHDPASRRVLRVDAHVVVGEVGGEVRRAARHRDRDRARCGRPAPPSVGTAGPSARRPRTPRAVEGDAAAGPGRAGRSRR